MKKSSYSKKIVKLLKKEYKEDLEKSKIKTELNSSADSKYQAKTVLLKCQRRFPLVLTDWVCCVCQGLLSGPRRRQGPRLSGHVALPFLAIAA